MKTDNFISVPRLFNLVKRDIRNNITTAVIAFGAVTALAVFISALTAYHNGESEKLYFVLYINLVFIGGLIVTSGSFREMHRKETVQTFLMLPASSFEKLTSRLLLSAVVYPVAAVIGIMVISLFSEGLNIIFFRRHNELFNPFSVQVWLIAANYLVAQSVFFLGSAYFRKHHFIKTINVIFLFGLAVSIFGTLIFRIVYFDMFEGFLTLKDPAMYINWDMLAIRPETIKAWITAGKVFYWIIPAPLFWTISYFRVREAEVKNAV